MKLLQKLSILILSTLIMSLTGCSSNNEAQSEKGNPLSGDFVIATDEAHFPIVKVLVDAYLGLYPMVNIRIDSTISGNPYQKLLDEKVRMIVTGIPFSEKDSMALVSRGVFVQVSPMAIDALVFFTKLQSDTTKSGYFSIRHDSCVQFHVNQMEQMILSNRTGSENNFQLSNTISKLDSNAFSFSNNSLDVLTRIQDSESYCGVVSWSYLCERKSKTVKDRLKAITILPYRDSASKQVYPSQSSIAAREYPLTRQLLMVTSEPYAGPATGFAAWTASSEGQRIIRLFGGAPIRIPPREIHISN